MAKKVKLMFDGEPQECLVVNENGGEVTCFAKDRRFVRFPAGVDLAAAVKAHNEANKTKPLPPEDLSSKAELEEWFD